MRLILAAMCVLMVLFMGGCALVSVSVMPLPLLPAGIAVLNLMMLAVIFKRTQKRWPAAFYILGVIDLVVAILAVVSAINSGPQEAPLFYLSAFAFLVKGVFSILYIRRKPGDVT
jgi:uncharacterized membrane protein HdeD (DUF308 family)